MAFLPGLGLWLVPITEEFGIRSASLISSIGLLFFPLAVIGMSSPALIQLNVSFSHSSGKSSGKIYAISTFGGILSALMMGFYFLPELGVRKSMFVLIGLLLVTILVFYGIQKQFRLWFTVVCTGTVFIMLGSNKPFSDPKIGLRFLYRSEGILGQIAVLENPQPETRRFFRLLMINQIPQTQDNVATLPISGWSYPHRMATLVSKKPAGSKALLIGMGGGNIAMELKKMGFSVDVVERDERMPFVAENYFGFEPKDMKVVIDDGRHFIRTTLEKYDLVLTDVLNGEVQPYHIFTKEAFEDLKKILNPNALVLVNFQGFLLGEKGRAARSIYKTMEHVGFSMEHFFSGDNEDDGDIHFIASLDNTDADYRVLDEGRLNACCKLMPHEYHELVTSKSLSTEDGVVFTDDRPQLEFMNVAATENWRQKTIDISLMHFPSLKIPFFK